MLREASKNVVRPWLDFVENLGAQRVEVTLNDAGSVSTFAAHQIGTKIALLIATNEEASDLRDIALRLKDVTDSGNSAHQVIIGLVREQTFKSREAVVSRGVKLASLQTLVTDVIGAPGDWWRTQYDLLDRLLETIGGARSPNAAELQIVDVDASTRQASTEWILGAISRPARRRRIYVCAEAGKGKSTLLAMAALEVHKRGDLAPVVLFPLREAVRGGGISWESLCSIVGLVGNSAQMLAHAVKAGLVVPLFDGLDEVSGRYDSTLIKQVAAVVRSQTQGDRSITILSGRTAEGTLLDDSEYERVGIELPEAEQPGFATYVGAVLDSLLGEWTQVSSSLAKLVPNLISGHHDLHRAPSGEEGGTLRRWVARRFDSYGKERSLFFVQSLCCIGRLHQLSGKPLMIAQRDCEELADSTTLMSVCSVAAALAAVREQFKVAPQTQSRFTPSKQVDLLAWLAVLSSAQDLDRMSLPSANELAGRVFEVDPVHENEEFTDIIRQMQKHALIYASRHDTAVGEWKPAFLSEWLHAYLLVRAWIESDHLAADPQERARLKSSVTRASRGWIAFGVLFPEAALSGSASEVVTLARELVLQADCENAPPETTQNFWTLFAGLDEETREKVVKRPAKVIEFSDFSDQEFHGISFGSEFSASCCILAGAAFDSCVFKNVTFAQCEFRGAHFASCSFENCEFRNCEGPVEFDSCEFKSTKWTEFRCGVSDRPALHFAGCSFRDSLVSQQERCYAVGVYRAALQFDTCLADVDAKDLVTGQWSGIDGKSQTGLSKITGGAAPDPVDECLRRLLKPFFPTVSGMSGELQARGYVRSSAIGRGAFPAGAPTAAQLIELLTSEGFTRGGRQAHVYAPWSSVVGREGTQVRADCVAFLRLGQVRGRVQSIRAKLRKLMNS